MNASTQRPHPSSIRLFLALTFVSLGCLAMHDRPWSHFSAILFVISMWCMPAPGAKLHRSLSGRELFWVLTVLAALGAGLITVVVTTRGKEFPAFEHFVRHPAFISLFWLLLCFANVYSWCRMRRTQQPRGKWGSGEHC
jgi:hypothetical protein